MESYKCKQQDKCPNCFANEGGYCKILNNTDFNRRCPFYKPKEEQKEPIEKYKIKFREAKKCKKI